MSSRFSLVALAAILLGALPSQAQLLVENFDYPTGPLVGQGGWAVTGTTSNPVINVTANNLTFPDYPSATGNAVSLATSGQDANRSITQQTSGALYAAFLVRVNSAGTGDYFFHFTQSPITSNIFLGRVFARSATGGVQFGIGKTSTSTTYDTDTYAVGDTVLVVLKYQFVAGGTTNDAASIYTFAAGDDYSTEPGTPSATNSGGNDATNLGFVNLRQGSTSAGVSPTLVFDGLRVGTSYAAVTQRPAPTSFTFVRPTASTVVRAGAYLKPIYVAGPDSLAQNNVTITLRKGGATVATLYQGPNLARPNFTDARYRLPITTPGGTDYTVYVELDSDPAVNAESAPFTITARPVIVTSPNGGEEFAEGDQTTVTFSTNGFGSSRRALVYLRRLNVAGSTLLATEEGTDGSVDITLPEGVETANNYFVVVRVSDGTTTAAGRSGTFRIVGTAPEPPRMPAHFVPAAAVTEREAWLTVRAAGLVDGAEVGVFAGDVLVGAGLVAGGAAEVVVRGGALDDGAALTLRAFDGAAETALAVQSVTDVDGKAATLAFEDLAELTVETAKGATTGAAAFAVAAWPNPAAGVVGVRVSAPASVAVYDVLGRQVADLGTVEAEARWDATGAAPGVYVVRATTGETVQTVRVTVAR